MNYFRCFGNNTVGNNTVVNERALPILNPSSSIGNISFKLKEGDFAYIKSYDTFPYFSSEPSSACTRNGKSLIVNQDCEVTISTNRYNYSNIVADFVIFDKDGKLVYNFRGIDDTTVIQEDTSFEIDQNLSIYEIAKFKGYTSTNVYAYVLYKDIPHLVCMGASGMILYKFINDAWTQIKSFVCKDFSSGEVVMPNDNPSHIIIDTKLYITPFYGYRYNIFNDYLTSSNKTMFYYWTIIDLETYEVSFERQTDLYLRNGNFVTIGNNIYIFNAIPYSPSNNTTHELKLYKIDPINKTFTSLQKCSGSLGTQLCTDGKDKIYFTPYSNNDYINGGRICMYSVSEDTLTEITRFRKNELMLARKGISVYHSPVGYDIAIDCEKNYLYLYLGYASSSSSSYSNKEDFNVYVIDISTGEIFDSNLALDTKITYQYDDTTTSHAYIQGNYRANYPLFIKNNAINFFTLYGLCKINNLPEKFCHGVNMYAKKGFIIDDTEVETDGVQDIITEIFDKPTTLLKKKFHYVQ